MISHKLSQIYKQYPLSILYLFVVLYETCYDQHNYFWYYRPSIIDYRPSITDYRPSIIDYRPSITDYRPSIIDYRPSIIDPFTLK